MSAAAVLADRERLVAALARSLETATGAPVERVETHLSWLLLTRDRAFKIKKPLTLPFADFASLEVRRHCCEEEVRLNARLAPTIYLGVDAITGSVDAPHFGGDGATIEYAVRMRRFAPGALFSQRLAAGTLTAGDIDRLAERIAHFHAAAPRAAQDSDWGTPAARAVAALQAFDGCAVLAPDHVLGCATLRPWLDAQAVQLAPLWAARRAAGRVRECHGDLHLANVLVDGDEVLAFDGIEFAPSLRWIDVIDDAAFAAMDLQAHGRPDLAWRYANAWLDQAGEHAGVAAWRYAVVYRALVRAHVGFIRAAQRREAGLRGVDAGAGEVSPAAYLAVAVRAAQRNDRRLLITHGLPGSGKSWLTQHLLERAGALRLRSDVERKRLAGLAPLDDSRARGLEIYDAASTARTYERLLELARVSLQAGQPTIVDAAFLRSDERAPFAALAHELGVPYTILACHAPLALLRERVAARGLRRDDASEADLAVLDALHGAAEPLDADERAAAINIDTAATWDAAGTTAAWLARRVV
jgi:aminoglycoside phosphotransferase family enzyme/predicted kinase